MIVPEFGTFKQEGVIIGRLVTGYGALESTLSSCIAMGIGDFNVAIKTMFRARGETQRIEIADALGRPAYMDMGLGDMFSEAIADMRFCLKIRNQYAHCQWHDDNSGRICFVDMEDIAKEHAVLTNFLGLTFHYLTPTLLAEQEKYFEYVADCFLFLNYEGRRLAGTISTQIRSRPKKVLRPPLHVP
jgi:hypothetical protein